MNSGQTVIKDYAIVDEAAQKLLDEANRMEQLFSEIKSEINKIGDNGDGTWGGDAANEVKAKFDAWTSKFESFVSVMRECSNHVKQVSANFKEADDRLNQSVQSV